MNTHNCMCEIPLEVYFQAKIIRNIGRTKLLLWVYTGLNKLRLKTTHAHSCINQKQRKPNLKGGKCIAINCLIIIQQHKDKSTNVSFKTSSFSRD